jgi:hypothetical protein
MRNATLLLLVLLAPARLAAIATLSVADGSGAPGDDVEISIDLSGGGGSAATLQLDLLFLADALSIDPATDCRLDPRLQTSHVLVATNPFLAAPPGERRIRVAVLDLTFPVDAFADGPAVTCTFHLPPIVAITSVPLRPERFEVGDSNGDPLPSTVVGGLVTVQPVAPDRARRQCIVAINRTAFHAGVTHLAVDCDGFDDAQPNASCG